MASPRGPSSKSKAEPPEGSSWKLEASAARAHAGSFFSLHARRKHASSAVRVTTSGRCGGEGLWLGNSHHIRVAIPRHMRVELDLPETSLDSKTSGSGALSPQARSPRSKLGFGDEEDAAEKRKQRGMKEKTDAKINYRIDAYEGKKSSAAVWRTVKAYLRRKGISAAEYFRRGDLNCDGWLEKEELRRLLFFPTAEFDFARMHTSAMLAHLYRYGNRVSLLELEQLLAAFEVPGQSEKSGEKSKNLRLWKSQRTRKASQEDLVGEGNGVEKTQQSITRRMTLAKKCFEVIDANNNGVIDLEDIMASFQRGYPDTKKTDFDPTLSPEQVANKLFTIFTRGRLISVNNRGLEISDWMEYYKNVSQDIDSDTHFERIICNSWGIPKRVAKNARIVAAAKAPAASVPSKRSPRAAASPRRSPRSSRRQWSRRGRETEGPPPTPKSGNFMPENVASLTHKPKSPRTSRMQLREHRNQMTGKETKQLFVKRQEGLSVTCAF